MEICVEKTYLLCYNRRMKKLFYATFEKGYEEIVKKIIKKTDGNSQIKKLYGDSVLFFADEKLCHKELCFKSLYVVIHNSQKEGTGAINYEMKNLLEKKDLKVVLPREADTFKFIITKENERTLVDGNLKKAVETMLRRVTKKTLSYMAGKVELVLLAKSDGTNLFMRKVYSVVPHDNFALGLDELYMLGFLSEPSQGEVVLDPFAGNGEICYARSKYFKKSNVIANDEDEENVKQIKKVSKSLKENSFSVLNYEFLSENFPIKHINKIITNLTGVSYDSGIVSGFFDKAYDLKVGLVVALCPKGFDHARYFKDKYIVEAEIQTKSSIVYKLKIRG